mgnify:CR=1 FL=1
MEETYRNGLAEVDMILNYANEESLSKIPESLKQFIKENKSDYITNINPEKDLKDQDLLYETKVILSVLYRDYWASSEERRKLLEYEKAELTNIENRKNEKYNYNNLFKNKNNEIGTNVKEIKSLVVKQNLIKKILNKMRGFFRLEVK